MLDAMLQAPAFQVIDQFFAGARVPEICRAHRDCDSSGQQELHDDIRLTGAYDEALAWPIKVWRLSTQHR